MIPTGTIVAYPGIKPPLGWMACDGSAFDMGTYAELFDLLQKNTVPDLRGQFLRGLDTSGNIDPDAGRAILSTQQDELRAHSHSYLSVGWEDGDGGFSGGSNKPQYRDTSGTGGPETRPKNVAVLYIIYLGPASPSA
jgi:hypothetical protein